MRTRLQPAVSLAVLTTLLVVPLVARPQQPQPDPGAVTLERLFDSSDFRLQTFGPARWLDADHYTTLEAVPPGARGRVRQIIRHDARTGAPQVMVSAERPTPPAAKEPLAVADYHWTPDGGRLLVYTNSQRVWRQNTRGDYWVLDLKSGALRKIGGDAKSSTLCSPSSHPS